jgi:hypothetical protein
MEQLNKCCKRDNATLIGVYNEIKIGTNIQFKCKCNVVANISIRDLRVTGFSCKDCLLSKKGFYQKDPDNIQSCSVCDLKPSDGNAITEDNWETCWGRNMFFCPLHRVQYPCNNEECDADLCYNFREDKNWKNIIKYWDYENEKYN